MKHSHIIIRIIISVGFALVILGCWSLFSYLNHSCNDPQSAALQKNRDEVFKMVIGTKQYTYSLYAESCMEHLDAMGGGFYSQEQLRSLHSGYVDQEIHYALKMAENLTAAAEEYRKLADHLYVIRFQKSWDAGGIVTDGDENMVQESIGEDVEDLE